MGIGRYTAELVQALTRADYPFEWFGYTRKPLPEQVRFSHVFRRAIRVIHLSANRLWYEQVLLPFWLGRDRIALFHSPDFILPLWTSIPCVVTVHDLSFLDVPETLSPRARRLYSTFVPLSLRRASAVIVDSHFTAMRLKKWFPDIVPRVIYPGVDEKFFQPGLHPVLPFAEPYLFFCGLVEKRKSPEILLYLAESLRKERKMAQMVVVGRTGYGYHWFSHIARQYGIHYLSVVSEEQLHNLYAYAMVFVYPSRYEGFGFSVLEAMASGVPVVTFRIPVLDEIGGEGMIACSTAEEMKEAVFSLLKDGNFRASVGEKAKRNARRFSWNTCAQQMLAVYQEILQERGVVK